MKTPAVILSVSLVMSAPVLIYAQTTTDLNNQVTTMNNTTASQGQTNVTNKISSDFKPFLGSDSTAVVTGLRNGTPITLTSTTPSSTPGGLPVTTTTVITPPTGHMGFGNVYISLALAKQQLSTLGITQPTPEQLQAALTGGTITQTTSTGATATTTTTNLQGILTMRSQNMGWGQIAQKLGFKLGPVIAGMKSANQNLASTTTTTAATSNGNSVNTASGQKSGSGSGIVTASGRSSGNPGNSFANGKSSGDGIVSASGKGNGNAYGVDHSGITTGSGSSAGSNGGIVSAGGSHGRGVINGNGHNK